MAFCNTERFTGWRENSQQTQWSGFASVKYNPSENFNVGIEYTGLRNLVQMPGGENDSMFYANPQGSLRARNWLDSPWNIGAAHLDYKINDNSSLHLVSSYLSVNAIWSGETKIYLPTYRIL